MKMMLNLKEWMIKVTSVLAKVEKTSQSTDVTKTNSSVWQSGEIRLYKRSNIVTLKFNATVFGATSTRTDFATIPEAYRPITETGGMFDSSTTWFFVRPNGTVATNQAAAGTRWGTVTYIAQN